MRARLAGLAIPLALGGCLHTDFRARHHPWDERSRQIAFESYLAGAGAAAITVPGMVAAGTAIGGSTSNLAAAAVPALLLNLMVPPVAVTTAQYAVGRARKGPRVVRFHPAVWAAVLVNTIGIVLGAVGGVATTETDRFAMYSLFQSLAMPLASQLTMHYTERVE